MRAGYSGLAAQPPRRRLDTRGFRASPTRRLRTTRWMRRVADLAAVVESASPGTVNLLALGTGKSHGDHVRRREPRSRRAHDPLARIGASARSEPSPPTQRALTSLIEDDWPLYLAAMTHSPVRLGGRATRGRGTRRALPRRNRYSAPLRTAMIDVTRSFRSGASRPTTRDVRAEAGLAVEGPRNLAARIPDAQFKAVDGRLTELFAGAPRRARQRHRGVSAGRGAVEAIQAPSGTADHPLRRHRRLHRAHRTHRRCRVPRESARPR